MLDAKKHVVEMIQSSNTIHLVAGTEVQKHLSEYIHYQKQILNTNNEIVKNMSKLIQSNNKDKLLKFGKDLTYLDQYSKLKLQFLKDAMRKDLEIE